MSPRICSIASRRIRPPPRSFALGLPTQRRLASSDRQPSNISEFYKNFTRPVAKVLLMAVFTYQLAYWGWVKLEQDEIRAEREGEIASLEHQVAGLAGFRPALSREQFGPDGESPPIPSLRTDGKEPTLEDYQLQLMKHEQQWRDGLKKRGQPDPGAVKAGSGGEKNAAPWWKLW